MSETHSHLSEVNPFVLPDFIGRQRELHILQSRLNSKAPQHCAIIGETSFGKTRLLRHLSKMPELQKDFIFVYLDCKRYMEFADEDENASLHFWRYMFRETKAAPDVSSDIALDIDKEQSPREQALHFRLKLEKLFEEIASVTDKSKRVVYLLDNFEGVAHLHDSDSQWLRSLALRYCTYVASSRYLLYLLFQYDAGGWANPSPLWNIFTDPIYIGLLREQEVDEYLEMAKKQAAANGSRWREKDIQFIQEQCGGHPVLLRLACKLVFDYRLYAERDAQPMDYDSLYFSLATDAAPTCNQLWLGADPVPRGQPGASRAEENRQPLELSPHQQAFLAIARRETVTHKKILFDLAQRGLLKRDGESWTVFANVMRDYILALDEKRCATIAATTKKKLPETEPLNVKNLSPLTQTPVTAPVVTNNNRTEPRSFTFLEGRVYDYLRAHVGTVCDREEIKAAVWDSNPPSNTALQKIIERIREKIEDDAKNPRYLIAARGQGYMLREDPIAAPVH